MIKKLLIVGAIIAIIPLERENQAELYQAAKSTVADITGFCARNPGVCVKGNEAIDNLATKAEFGARLMIDIAKEQSINGPDEVAQILKATRVPGYQPSRESQANKPLPVQSNERFPTYRDKQYNDHYGKNSNTLRPSDLQADWRGNPTR